MAKSRLRLRAFLFVSRFRRGMTLGVRAAIFDAEERVFLIKHSYLPGWHLPGGGVEVGETFGQALEREVLEEGGIALDAPPALFALYRNMTSGRDHVALYVCRRWNQARPLKVPNLEIVDAGFFSRDALPEGVTEATRRRITEILDGVPPAAEW